MKKFFRKHKWLGLILVLLASVVVTGFVSTRTDGFNDMAGLFTRDLNEDNILQIGDDGNYTVEGGKTLVRENNGLIVTVANNGALKINGDIETESGTFDYVFATVTLPAGTYTLTSGKNGASETASVKNVWLSVRNADTDAAICNGDFGGSAQDGTFELTSETQVEVVVNIYPAEYDGYTVYPVLVKGSEAGGFYA